MGLVIEDVGGRKISLFQRPLMIRYTTFLLAG